MGVSVLIPTRDRPKRFRKAVESLLRTKTGTVEVIAYRDDDDPSAKAYEDLDLPVRWIVGPRIGLAKAIHRLIEASLYGHMFLGADDIEFITVGWDEKMVAALPEDEIGLVYCEDNWKQTCNHVLFHQKWVSLTGFFPDDFEHFGPDTYILSVAKELNRAIYLKDVVIEHHHQKNNKAPNDATYIQAREGGILDRDKQRLKRYERRIKRDIEVLREYI